MLYVLLTLSQQQGHKKSHYQVVIKADAIKKQSEKYQWVYQETSSEICSE